LSAVSSIGPERQIAGPAPSYFAFLHGKLRPEGRLLNHCITRPDTASRPRVGVSSTANRVFPTAS